LGWQVMIYWEIPLNKMDSMRKLCNKNPKMNSQDLGHVRISCEATIVHLAAAFEISIEIRWKESIKSQKQERI
nr:hypothetical protein [Tanacetum cinerariifolium]